MDCEHTQSWLLQADTLHPECWPSDLAEHVKQCSACGPLACEMRQLEDDWRHMPIPAGAEIAQKAFLEKLPAFKAALTPVRRRWAPTARWAAVAVFLIGVGSVTWVMMLPGGAQASSDIVERLIDFHLTLSETVDLAERQRLLAEREHGFREDLLKARITPEERELAEKLLENGLWLAAHDDPLEEAGRYSDITDKLVGRIETATKMGNIGDTERHASCYKKMEFGMHQNMERAAQMKPKEAAKWPGFEQIQKRDQWQRQQMEKITECARPDLRKLLESMHKQFRPPAHGGIHGFKK